MRQPTAAQVAFVTDAPRVAGSEVWLLDVLPLLPTHGLSPTVFLPRGEALDELARRFGEAGVPVRRFDDPQAITADLNRFGLRVVQAWDPGTYRLLDALHAPRVAVVHDQLDYHYPAGLKGWYRLVYRATKLGGLRRADSVMTVSAWGQAFLQGRMGLPRVGGLRNGVNPDRYRPATPAEREALRARLGFRGFTVLVPGRFAPEKNQLAAVLAARHARNLNFVFAGDMDSGVGRAAQVLAGTLRLRNVTFLGRRWDLPDLYRAADALLQPTLAENQSLVTLEAMASGLPVVTTPIPAQAELIRDGVDGLLVSPAPHLLARALQAMAAAPDRTAQFGAAARQRVLERHTLTGTAAQVAARLRACLPD
ncbi:glycosyltransferase family 4 protein [Deinococcus depolymerans]|uniref:Glycosyltransferase family 4 protein n=1 Tax=Deinococcus depolymerans TaxID=392408 RepID=A0ABP3LJ10_9DEIO